MKRRDCTTCDRSHPPAQFAKPPEGSRCTHDRDTCKRCWHQWLKAQVASKTLYQITCAQCSNVLSQSEIRALATKAVYERYLDAEFEATTAADPQFRWCLAPDCKSGQIHREGDIFRCVDCDFKACANCHVAWHEDETCSDFQARIQVQPGEEASSAETLGRIAKLCPGCQRKVQKEK